jgi:hypothetical protein
MTENVCPTCGDQFDSRRGLGVHHSSVHDERLPNRECAECSERFYSEYEQKYCSDECRVAGAYVGENNPNYRGGKEQTECKLWSAPFEYYPSEKEGLYCPDCVETESWRSSPPLEGEANPRWKGGKLELECAACEALVERYPADVTGEVTVCDRDCLSDWLSVEFTGEGHPNWKGGDTGNYGPGWNRVRREALQRDGHECVICGTTKADLGRNPDVHHVVPVRVFAASGGASIADAHRLANVVTLCPPCHRQADFGKLSREQLWEAVGVETSIGEILPAQAASV